MFVTFVTWMVHDFCHDIDNSKSNGAFYNLFQTEKTNNRLKKISGHIIQNGGKNVSYDKKIDDYFCNNTSVNAYTPQDIPSTVEEFYVRFNSIYSEDQYENYRILYSIVKDVIEDIKLSVEQGLLNKEIFDSIIADPAWNGINIQVDSVIEMEMLYKVNHSGIDTFPIMVNFLYQKSIQIYSATYLSMLFNPVEFFIKEYIEINYNFRDKSYKDPDTIKALAQDYISCPYRFRIMIEIISNLVIGENGGMLDSEVYGSFKDLYYQYSKLYNDNFDVYISGVEDGKLFQRKKYPGINEEYKLNMFYEIVKIITYNFIEVFNVNIFITLKDRLISYGYLNSYLDIENIKTIYIKEVEKQFSNVVDINDIDIVEMFGGSLSKEYSMGLDDIRGGGLKDDIVSNFNNKFKDISDLMDGYEKNDGEYNIDNFDNTIIDFIINPNDNLPYSDFVNDNEIEQDVRIKIQEALNKVLLEQDVNKKNISDKLTELKEHKKVLENNNKELMCNIYRTPPRISSNHPLLLYKNDFDGLIFLAIYEIIYYIKLESLVVSGELTLELFNTYIPVDNNPFINYLTRTYPGENGERVPKNQENPPPKLRPQGKEGINNIMINLSQFPIEAKAETHPQIFYQRIQEIININKLKIDLIEKQTEFLKYQKPYYMGKGNLTPQQKTQKKQLINNVIDSYRDILAQIQVTNNAQDISPLQNEINRIFYYSETFNKDRPEGGTLDSQMWKDHIKPELGGRSVSSDNFVNTPDIQSISEYLNNAISRKYLDILGKNKNVICFASLIDPMSTFGDCSFLNDIKDKKGTIYIHFGVDANNYFKVDLKVTPNNNVTVEGKVELKILGMEMINVDIDESNFNKKTPFSIANTVAGFTVGDIENNRNQAVKKFLGDYLQGMEAIRKGYIYYSGDKPATAMYDYMNKAFSPNNSYGGFVDPSNGSISGQSIPAATVQGGGKKKKRSLRKKKKHRDHKLLLSNKYSKKQIFSRKKISSRKKRSLRKKKKHRDHKQLLSNKK